MKSPITAVEEVNPERITDLLRQNGWLHQGKVTSLEKTSSQPFGSIMLRLELRYSPDTEPALPHKLILKLEPAGSLAEDSECRFYAELASRDLPLVTCFDACYDATTKGYHLLLHDVSETHYMLELESPTPRHETARMLETLARLHAHWWGDPRLGKLIPLIDTEFLSGSRTDSLPGFFDFLGDRLSDVRRRIYEQVVEKLPALLTRQFESPGVLTLAHDDAHPWNFLLPRDGKQDHVYLIDWQQWGASIGLHDVAYHIALFWYPERRQRMERDLVKHYHEQLLRYGVTGYDWETCWTDYRIFAARNLMVPLWAWKHGHWARHRWSQMEKALLAYEDLHLAELLV